MRRVRRKGGNKEKVFGCDLMEHLNTTGQEIPQVLCSCSEFIEEHGIVDGIYRLSGVSSNIQKLRSEFDSEGNPDLSKDVYHQDIHCVSSLCKAYFRELPNPLLTYQLYDRFAEAVAVQLEDERLVKIQEVLRSLPPQHFRTLEFLMRHLVKMSTYSAETNMHARNLAIVWAPNLLRSKDIEASGFNGTAAFMEVRVQSIVVEFILTHVPQLFPDNALGVPNERRKSLPSPTSQDDTFFRAMPFQYPGNMSPGDGPPAMRPYHAIIEPTDKRKGSLKGRKWRSIFNLGGRLPDPRKRNKGSTKEKEKQTLRPAKSMDSLSPGPFDGNRQGASPTQLSPVAPLGQEGGSSGGGLAANSYAVTYRRGGGASVSVVSGSGTQGTYSRLDSVSGASGGGEGAGPAAAAAVTGLVAGGGLAPVARSPGQASRAEKRAGIHISGPFSVTVPLHITSGLLGVIQGSQGEEETPASAQEEGERRRRGKGEEEEEEKREEEEEKERSRKEDRKREEEEKEEKEIKERTTESGSSMGGEKEEEGEGEGETHTQKVEVTPPAIDGEGEERSLNGHLSSEDEEEEEEEEEEEDLIEEDEEEAAGKAEEEGETGEGDYMEMRATLLPPASAEEAPEVGSSVNADVPMSVEEEYPDADLPLDFQDTFGFLDMMDSMSQPNNEFSVEPPCENEYEDNSWEPHDDQTSISPPQKAQPSPPSPVPLRTPTSRPMSLPLHTRLPSKSHSLPYKCSPSYPNVSSYSDEDEDEDEDEIVLSDPSDEDEDEDDDERGEYEDMFVRSLPNELEFHSLASRGEPLPANSSEDTCLSGQSEDRMQTDFILSGGYVNMSMGGRSHDSNQTETSSSVSCSQSEGTVIHNEDPLPISSQNINDVDQLQSSPVTDTGLLANQLMDILHLSQSECSEVQTDSSNGATNKEMDEETHGEERKEEEMGEEKTSCQEGQGVDAGPDAHTQLDQDSTSAYPGPPLPPRDHRNNKQTDSNGCHGERPSDCEVEKVDWSDLHPASTTAAPSQGEARTCTGEGSASESETSFNVVSHEPTGEGWQDGTYRKEEEEGEEMEEEKDGENDGKIETGDVDEEESDREGGGQEERVTDEEVEEDGETEKEGEQKVGSNEGEWTEREEEDEGQRLPVAEEEEEDQPDGSERVVTDQKNLAEETADQRSTGEEKEEKEENEAERGENESLVSTGEAGAVIGQVGKEREEVEEGHTEEGHLAPVERQAAEQLPESQTDHRASEGAEKSELPREEREGAEQEEQEEQEEQGENPISEAEQGGERHVGEERKDRESKTDDKPASLGQGVGRTLVVSKQAPVRTHQAKSVPVVPPKPQQSRLTALGLRQQMQSRDTHSPQQKDRDVPHTHHTHDQDTKGPPQDMQHTPYSQTPDTTTLNTLHDDRQHQAQVRHTESPVAQEHTGAALHTGDTTQPCGPEIDPITEHRDTDPHLPHITINQQPPQMETPEQSLDTRVEQHAAHRQRETEGETSGDVGGAREQGAEGKDGQAEQRDAEAERWRGPPHQSETEAGRDGSADVKKDKLGLREGDRERRTRDREVKRNSGISICFDEAVARATREREREREHSEREKERERGVSVQDEKARLK
ncbi:apoptotic chromatin condensation inducer in the nucleus [Sardina pilchardus]|uniref:apoptotic chromatin condensation inducer in the nucleus n=1 Tax=Sardina pilchardus TaxID=27697 RepID=UPI002E0FCE80